MSDEKPDHFPDYERLDEELAKNSERWSYITMALIFGLIIVLLATSCGSTGGKVIQVSVAKPVAQELSAVTDAAGSVQSTAEAIKEDTKKTAAAVPAVVEQPAFQRIDKHADKLMTDVVKIEAAAETAKAKDLENTVVVKQLQTSNDTLAKQNSNLIRELDEIKASNLRKWIALAWLIGIALFPVAGGVGWYFQNLKAAGAMAVAGAGLMGAAILGQQLLKLQSFFLWSLASAFVILLTYAVYSAITRMRRHFDQVVETANALATVPPEDGTEMARVSRLIQDVDTSALVKSVKSALNLKRLPDPKL